MPLSQALLQAILEHKVLMYTWKRNEDAYVELVLT